MKCHMLLLLLIIGLLAPVDVRTQGLQWMQTFGGAGSDIGYGIVPATGGGWLVAGITTPVETPRQGNVYLVKTTADGILQWEKGIGTMYNAFAHSIFRRPDGTLMLIGQAQQTEGSDYDCYLLHADDTGRVLREASFGSGLGEFVATVKSTRDAGYIVAGLTIDSTGRRQPFLMKVDSAGTMSWNRTYWTDGPSTANDVIELAEGGFAATGVFEPPSTKRSQMYLLRTGPEGDSLSMTICPTADIEMGAALQQTSDGGFLVAATSYSITGYDQRTLLTRFDRLGAELWDSLYTFGNLTNSIHLLERLDDGGYLMLGGGGSNARSSGILVAVLDSLGRRKWSRVYGDTTAKRTAWAWVQNDKREFVITGTEQREGDYQMLLLAVDPRVASNVAPPVSRISPSIRPIPATTDVEVTFHLELPETVRLELVTPLGRIEQTIVLGELPAGRHSHRIAVTGLTDGVLYCRILAGSACHILPIVVRRH